MLYSDKPIDRPKLDLLGRAPFAHSLARAIDNLIVAKDGFVIAIQGEWGSGKTSLVLMVCRYLLHIEMERTSRTPLVWETAATPKTVADLEEMAETFEKIEVEIASLDKHYRYSGGIRSRRDSLWHDVRRKLNSDHEADEADRYWQLKQSVETAPRTTVVRFSPWLISGRAELASALLSDLGRALGATFGDEFKQAFGKLLQRVMEFAPVVGAGLDIGSHGLGAGLFTRAGRDWSAKIADRMTTGPTLEEIREQLIGLLAGLQNRRVLVVIDDLDRLTPAEAIEIVSALKSLADLPNVIYMLSYDHSKMSNLIQAAIHVDGHEFLEKIGNYALDVP